LVRNGSETVRAFNIEKVYICGMPSQLITYKELIAPISLAHTAWQLCVWIGAIYIMT
jgi:hypothetical protein